MPLKIGKNRTHKIFIGRHTRGWLPLLRWEESGNWAGDWLIYDFLGMEFLGWRFQDGNWWDFKPSQGLVRFHAQGLVSFYAWGLVDFQDKGLVGLLVQGLLDFGRFLTQKWPWTFYPIFSHFCLLLIKNWDWESGQHYH